MSVPISTYRLQLHKDFPFSAAIKIIPYLKRLGIDAVYLSPILLAKPGSTHGYDICDHNRINPELGGEVGFQAYAGALKEADIGCILDFVPNHMGADPASNPWWWDILENGPSSPYCGYFDIDWNPLKPDLQGKVLLPILGDQYGKILERGELRLEFHDGALSLRYWDHQFPINPRMVPLVLENQDDLPMDESEADCTEYLSILTAYRNLPQYLDTDPKRIHERQREKEVARKRLNRLVESSVVFRDYIQGKVEEVNGVAGDVASFDRLHDLLEKQTYRLAYWRTAGHEINYRRFFDINGLMGLRMENPDVVAATHGMVMRLATEGLVTGLRLDHIDGLYDPAQYLRQLREMANTAMQATGKKAPGVPSSDFYIVIEKILCGEEQVRKDWPIQGTTGYEFLNDLNGLFADPEGLTKLDRLFRGLTGRFLSFADESRNCKRLILSTSMGSELNVLANIIDRLSEVDRNFRDFTLESLRDALREAIACLSIYRTYVCSMEFSEMDREAVDAALQAASLANPAMENSIFEYLRTVLLPHDDEVSHRHTVLTLEQRLDFAMRFQQLTGPIQAKGVEDTAYYRYIALLSLNDVGGEPDSKGMSIPEFHRRTLSRTEIFPLNMLATSTHDTKRGEDARARLNILTEFPDDWRRAIALLSKLGDSYRKKSAGAAFPSDLDEYLLYQSIVGFWPMDADGNPAPAEANLLGRLQGFAIKAARESKLHTSWINPNEKYEKDLQAFIETILIGSSAKAFWMAIGPILITCARLGALHSLAQIACKCAVPGVPDIYQGTEGWDLSLVDPDNRRPVDYVFLATQLANLDRQYSDAADAEEKRGWTRNLLDHWPDARIKQFTLWRCLKWRQAHPDLFLSGSYHALQVQSEAGDKTPWLAFYRQYEQQILVVCIRVRSTASQAVRFDPGLSLSKIFTDDSRPQARTEKLLLPPQWSGQTLTHVFTGRSYPIFAEGQGHLPMNAIAEEFPVAWLWLEKLENGSPVSE